MCIKKENSRKSLSLEEFLNRGYVFSGGSGEGEGEGNTGNIGDTGDTGDTGNAFTIPEAYKDKPYLQGVDSHEGVFKLLDSSQALIGKKTIGIPDETSTPNDIAAFHEARGVPKEHSEYTSINTTEGADTSFFELLKPLFKEANMTAKDVAIFEKGVGPIIEKITGDKVEKDKSSGEAFTQLAAEIFGNTKDNDLAQAKALLVANTPEGMNKYMDELSNEHLIIMASALKNVRAKYMNEDGSALGGDGGVDNTGGAEAIREQAKRQIGIAQDPKSTIDQIEAATKLAQEFYAKYDSMMKKK